MSNLDDSYVTEIELLQRLLETEIPLVDTFSPSCVVNLPKLTGLQWQPLISGQSARRTRDTLFHVN
jgi:hypothetical protein